MREYNKKSLPTPIPSWFDINKPAVKIEAAVIRYNNQPAVEIEAIINQPPAEVEAALA